MIENTNDYFQAGIEYFQIYIGTGMFVVLFLISLLYIYIRDSKEKIKTDILLRYSIIAILILFNPLMVYAAEEFLLKDMVYWRIFWIIPVVPVIAYAAAQAVSGCKEKKKKLITSIAILLIIVYCGKLVYNTGNFQEADNLYKIPQEAIDICDIINEQSEDGETIQLLVTPELASYIRQYDGTMKMLFGRHGRGNAEGEIDTVYEQLQSDTMDLVLITEIARDTGCNYLILNSHRMPQDRPEIDSLYEFGYMSVDTVGEYIIFKDIR